MTEQEYRAAYMREYRKLNKDKIAVIQHKSYMKHHAQRLEYKRNKRLEEKEGK